jgi:hypothetical protein
MRANVSWFGAARIWESFKRLRPGGYFVDGAVEYTRKLSLGRAAICNPGYKKPPPSHDRGHGSSLHRSRAAAEAVLRDLRSMPA